MSEPIEAEAGQQNQANDVPYTNADTAAQQIEGLFAMPEVRALTKKRKKRLVEVDQRTKQKEPKVQTKLAKKTQAETEQ